MEIRSRRFVLRDFANQDWDAFLAYQLHPGNLLFRGPDETGEAHARDLFHRFQSWARERPRRHYQLAIIGCGAEAELLGCCGLRQTVPGEAELGVELAPDYWGRHGYAIEISRALLDFGFEQLQLAAVTGTSISENRRVTRLAHWFGAELTNTREGTEWMQARGWCHVDWRITRENWLASQATVAD